MAKNISKLSAAMLPVAALTGCADKLPEKPNIVFLLFDDMGYGDLGCYGQELIETPHIDALAQQGIIFTDMYSSAPISAPSRCSIVTGQHAGHSQIRANEEAVPRGFDKGMPDWYFDRINADPEYEGQYPLAAGTETIGTMMQKAGYKTAMIGKWGLGGPTSEANPNKMGFDYFYGFNCQMLAHSYYPNYLWENGEKVMTGNEYMPVNRRLDPGADPYDVRSYDKFNQKYYAPDLMYERLENFVVENADNPFMVMWTTTVPHSTVQAPEDEVMYYVNKLGEEKTPITDGGWYYPVIYPKSSYAAMITHLDAQVGKLVQKLKDLGIYENTMFVITSDNGPASNSNSPMDYFKSGGPFKCTKGWGKSTLQEGGIRMPFIVSFGSHLTPGTSNHVGQSVDLMPTFAELAGVEAPENDGISFVPTLKGHKQPQHKYLYWEFPSSRGWVAVRWGNWKGLVRQVTKGNNKMELYDLQNDMLETTDLAEQHPEIVKQLWDFVKEAHQPVPNDVEKFKLDINFPE